MITQAGTISTTCVIGGNGFIGKAVVEALLAQQRRVIVVGRAASLGPLPAGVTYVVNNKKNNHNAPLREALNQSDEVINLSYATIPQTSFQHPVDDILLNLPEAVHLFELAATLPIRKFISVSSGGTVYGRVNTSLITEAHSTLPLSPYGITKLAIEKYAHMYFDNCGLPTVSVRPSNAFGPGQRPYSGQGFIGTAISSILDGRTITMFGNQGTVRDYLYVADMARGIIAALLDGIPGEVYNIGSGHGLSNAQVLDALKPLASASNKEIKVDVMPNRPFDVPINVLDSSKLKKDTGWVPQLTFPVALEKTWDWYVKHHSFGK